MKVYLIRVVVFIVCSAFYSAARSGGEQHRHQSEKATALKKHKYAYQGSAHSKYTKSYRLVVNLNELEGLPKYKSVSEVDIKMTPNQTQLVWSKLADEFPVSTDFKITDAEFKNNNVGYISLRLEESSSNIEISSSDLIVSVSNLSDKRSGYDFNESLGLHSYVDVNKWTKESGYQEAKIRLSKKNRPVIRATIIFNNLNVDGNADMNAYRKTFERIGIPILFDQMITLTDGTRGVEKLITLERLEKLYKESEVINIIPSPYL